MQKHHTADEPELFPETGTSQDEGKPGQASSPQGLPTGKDQELAQANERAARLEEEMAELRALVQSMAAERGKQSRRSVSERRPRETSVFSAHAGQVKNAAAAALSHAVHGDSDYSADKSNSSHHDQARAKGATAPRQGSSSGDSPARRQATELVNAGDDATARKQPPSPSTASGEPGVAGGEAELRKDSMMAHLLDSLDAHEDIGHYGRLVFAMVARHFLPHEEVLTWLLKDEDLGEEEANQMLLQVEARDYSPPRRDRILQWQAEQEFPILPNVDDPDCGNLYRNLNFPDAIYKHIEHYREQKTEAGE